MTCNARLMRYITVWKGLLFDNLPAVQHKSGFCKHMARSLLCMLKKENFISVCHIVRLFAFVLLPVNLLRFTSLLPPLYLSRTVSLIGEITCED